MSEPTKEDWDKVIEAVDRFGKDISDSFNQLKSVRLFTCHKCGKEIDPKGVVIVDQTNGFLHEECQGEYKGQ